MRWVAKLLGSNFFVVDSSWIRRGFVLDLIDIDLDLSYAVWDLWDQIFVRYRIVRYRFRLFRYRYRFLPCKHYFFFTHSLTLNTQTAKTALLFPFERIIGKLYQEPKTVMLSGVLLPKFHVVFYALMDSSYSSVFILFYKLARPIYF